MDLRERKKCHNTLSCNFVGSRSSLIIIDMDSLNKNMTEMIQQSAMSIAKQTKKQKKPKIPSPTRALMKKCREMIENKTPETT